MSADRRFWRRSSRDSRRRPANAPPTSLSWFPDRSTCSRCAATFSAPGSSFVRLFRDRSSTSMRTVYTQHDDFTLIKDLLIGAGFSWWEARGSAE